MVFWQRDEDLPQELRGKTPAEIAAALKAATDATAAAQAAADAKAVSDAALAAKQTEFDELKTRMETLEAGRRQETPPPPAGDPPQPASPWIDPEKFVDERTQRTTMVALAAGIMSAKMYFQQGLTSRDNKIFRKYEKEVESTVSTFAPEQRVMPQSWQNAFLYIKGLHDQDISKAESTNTDFFSETPSRTSAPPEDVNNEKLTPEEEEVCRRFHYDPKSYLERKKAGVLATSEKGQYARFPVTTSK